MGGPKVPWRAGRIDGFAKDATPDGRLPDAAQGQDHLRAVSDIVSFSPMSCNNSLFFFQIFYRMGYDPSTTYRPWVS
jgi:hypothetical protein